MPEQPRPGDEPAGRAGDMPAGARPYRAGDPAASAPGADPTLIADPTLVADPAVAAGVAAPPEVGPVPLETVLGLEDGDPLHEGPRTHRGRPTDSGPPEAAAGTAPAGGQAEVIVPPPPPPPPPGAIPAPPGAGPLPRGPSVVAGTRPGPAGRLGQVRQLGEGMTASQLASRLQLSSHAITVNDMVGALGALLIFIGYFVDVAYAGSRGLSLASSGGFWAALVPVFAPVSAAALMIPPARRVAGIWLALAASATGIALGSRNLAPLGYGAGWWLSFFGGVALCYAWVVRTTGRTDGPPPR